MADVATTRRGATAIAAAADRLGGMVAISVPLPDAPLCQLEPAAGKFPQVENVSAWLGENLAAVEDLLAAVGSVRLRGFPIGSTADFERIVGVFPDLEHGYAGGSTRRDTIGSSAKVFEATRAAPDVVLGLHQEMAYLPRYPGKLVFYCAAAPDTGGETMVGDMRRFTALLPDPILRRIEDRGLRYWRNFRSSAVPLPPNAPDKLPFFHMAWQDQFNTTDPAAAEAQCRAVGLDCHWEADGSLTSTYESSGFAIHPRDGGRVFHNVMSSQHAMREMLGPDWWDERCARFRRDRSPAPHYYIEYGDGSPLDPADGITISHLLAELARLPRWEKGDVLLIDNIYTAHGRNAYTGRRDVQTALLA